jgi:hypothetical protein
MIKWGAMALPKCVARLSGHTRPLSDPHVSGARKAGANAFKSALGHKFNVNLISVFGPGSSGWLRRLDGGPKLARRARSP